MPWSSQNGGGGGGGWKGGGPWGQGPSGGGPSPDLEELLKRSQDRLKQAMPGGGLGGGVLALIILVALVFIGFFAFTVSVQPNQQGVVLFFGKLDRTLTPGLKFRWPYPIEQVYLPAVTNVNRVEVGMRTPASSNFFGASGNDGPVRDVSEESLMLTGDENIVDVDFTVFWRISDAAAYLFNIQSKDSTVKDVAESAMREVVGQNDIQPILTKSRRETEEAVRTLMQKTLNEYSAGIEVTQVQLQQVDPPKEVIASFRDVQAARADQERLQNEADAYANRIIPEARGDAQRVLQAAEGYKQQAVAESVGRTQRFLKVYQEYIKAPDVTRKRIFLETMEKVFGKTEKIIIDSGVGGPGVVPYLPLPELNRQPRGDGATR